MIFCPKCGVSVEQYDENGNAALSCSSCDVVWLKFLESMADDAIWPDVAKRDKHDIICPKCGYERYPSDNATSRADCPQCRMSYIKLLFRKPDAEIQGKEPLAEQQSHSSEVLPAVQAIDSTASVNKQCPFCKELVHVDAVKCKHCGANIGLQIDAYKGKGKITGVGKLGIGLGLLMLWGFWKSGNVVFLGAGLFFLVGSYLLARNGK